MAALPPRWLEDVAVPFGDYSPSQLRNTSFSSNREGRFRSTMMRSANNHERGSNDTEDANKNVTLLSVAAIVAGAVGAIILLSIAFMRKYRSEKQSALVLAKKSAEASAVQISAITSPAHETKITGAATLNEEDYSDDYKIDGQGLGHAAQSPLRRENRGANDPIYVVWVMSPADMMSHARGEDGPYFERHVKAMRLLFTNAYNAPRVRLLVWLYDLESAPKSAESSQASLVNASAQSETCRLMRRYKLECAAHRDLHYSGNITVRHKLKSEWYGLYVAQYEALAHLSTTVAPTTSFSSPVVNGHGNTFMMYSSPSHWMVKHWDQAILGEWYGANTACSRESTAQHTPVLTCRPPTIKQTEAALLAIETERLRAVANNDAQQGNGLPYDSDAWVVQSREDKSSEAERQKLQQYRTSYQFAIDCGSFLPGTWSTFDHWCAIDCDLRLNNSNNAPQAPSSSQKNDRSALHSKGSINSSLPTEHHSKWQIFLPVANGGNQSPLFFQKVVIESDEQSVPIATGWYHSPFAFSTLKAFTDIPSDPRWIGLSPADGMDFVQSVRMWSVGCRFFHPTRTMCIDSSPTSRAPSTGPMLKGSRVLCIPKFTYENLYRYVYALCNQGSILDEGILENGMSFSKEVDWRHVGKWRMFGSEMRGIDAFYSSLGVFPSTGKVSIDAILGLFQPQDLHMEQSTALYTPNSNKEYHTMVKYGSWQGLHDAVNNLHATNHVSLKHTFSPYRTSTDRLLPSENDAPFHAFMRKTFMSHITTTHR